MKTFAPKALRGSDLRGLLSDLVATPKEVAKFLDVTERSVWRWLADGNAPRAALFALWHETPRGRYICSLDVGNELVIVKGLAQSLGAQADKQKARLVRVLAISDFGTANEPLWDAVPFQPLDLGRVSPLRFNPVAQARQLPDDQRGEDSPAQHNQSFGDDCARLRY